MKLNDIRDVAVIGSGVIGYSWALSFAMVIKCMYMM